MSCRPVKEPVRDCKHFHWPPPASQETYGISAFLVNQKFEMKVRKMMEA